jgi:hypothetical protein
MSSSAAPTSAKAWLSRTATSGPWRQISAMVALKTPTPVRASAYLKAWHSLNRPVLSADEMPPHHCSRLPSYGLKLGSPKDEDTVMTNSEASMRSRIVPSSKKSRLIPFRGKPPQRCSRQDRKHKPRSNRRDIACTIQEPRWIGHPL